LVELVEEFGFRCEIARKEPAGVRLGADRFAAAARRAAA
jgi:hypothetical protein